LKEFFDFVGQQSGKIAEQTLTHVGLTFFSLMLALLVGLPLGILLTRKKRWAAPVLGVVGVLQTIPSIALLGFLIPLLGIGMKPAVFALFLYALLPIVRNTFVGIDEVNATLKEAALGMGLTRFQLLRQVELPLAMPVIFAGIRTAAVINVGVATLAAYIAAGGLGEFIFGGIALNNTNMILAGAIPAALLAVLIDFVLAWFQRLKGRAPGYSAVWVLLLIPLFSSFCLIPRTAQTKLLAGFAHEFIGRADGYPGLVQKYGLRISTALIDQNLMYEAVYRGKVDVISGYSTDGRIKAFDLRVLDDDRLAFPPYQAAPVVRQATLDRHPELALVLEKLAGKISDSVMTEMNYRADYLHESPQQVAKDFLIKAGLFRPSRAGNGGADITIGSKIFTEQYILAHLLKLLIEGHTPLKVGLKTGFGGTKICFEALLAGEIDLYPEYTGTGLLVILQPSQSITDSLLTKEAVYRYVDQGFQQQYQLKWLSPLGFNNAYALMMRRSQAEALQINTISQLTLYLNE
jgi:osmoprotectant transport system permease protein